MLAAMAGRRRGSVFVLLFLAAQELRASPLAAVLVVLAVAAGQAFQIPNTANLAGYDAELLRQGVSGGAGDVRLRPRDRGYFDDGDAVAKRALDDPEVLASVPILILPGAVGARGRWEPTPVIAVASTATRQPFRASNGAAPAESGTPPGVLVGGLLATRLGVKDGDTVDLRVLLVGAPSPPPTASVAYTVTVRGIMRGIFTADEVVAVDRTMLDDTLGKTPAASMVLVYSNTADRAVPLARRLGAALPDASALAWTEDSAFLGSAIEGNRALNAISSAMAMVGVAIPVWALLFIAVSQRRRDIGLLSALGFSPEEVFAIFFSKALLVGLLGVGLGTGIGVVLVQWFEAHPIFESASFAVRPVLDARALLRPSALILVTTLVAGVFPAVRAARTKPALALRGLT
jgi:lipoprotein-releasing system permease protein